MRIKSQKDFFAGLFYLVVGGGFAIGATNYTIGDASRMGPGYFPMLVGTLLAILGVIIILQALIVETPDGDPIGHWVWRPLVYVILANFLFGILLGGIPTLGIPPTGLIIGIIVLTIVAAMAGTEFKLKEVLILAAILAIGSWAIFIYGLNLQMPVWPSFLGG